MTWFETTSSKPWNKKTISTARSPGKETLLAHEETGRAWEGFGGCFNELGWLALKKIDARAREKILWQLFDPEGDCRFTLCRLPMGASDYAESWYSLNETPGDFGMTHFSIERDRHCLIPYIRAAMKHQPALRLFASPWSPPTWMKNPMAYNYGRFRMEKRYLDAYALYFLKFTEAYAAEGMPIHQVHPQNEPVADQKFPSCVWTGPQLRDFIRDHLGPLFRRKNPDCELWLGTLNTDDYDGFVLPVLADDKARSYLSGVAYQWAGRGAVQRTHQSWPELRLMQSENECGSGTNDWDYARHVFELFHHYLSNGASAYAYWNMVLPPGGRSTWGWTQNSMITVDPDNGTVRENPEFHVVKHFAHAIRNGARRLILSGAWAGNSVAFVNEDQSLVVVAHNPLPESRPFSFRRGNVAFTVQMKPQSFHTFLIKSAAK